MKTCRWVGCVAMLLFFAAGAHALITALTPMTKILKDSTYVIVAKVQRFEPENKRLVLQRTENIKGKATFDKIPVVLSGDADAKKLNHITALSERLAVDLPVVLFISREKDSTSFTALAYTNGTWFALAGKAQGAEAGVWDLLHGEPYLRRTFNKSTDEMRKVVKDYLSGADQLPAVDEKEEPGFGPKISK